MKESDNRLENDFIIEQSFNLYLIAKLYEEKLLTDKEYSYLREKIKNLKYVEKKINERKKLAIN